MAKWIDSAILNHSSTATFQAWGSEYSGALTAVGLTKTSDTGQINWSTVAYSATLNFSSGYEIWRFNDTQQANLPIFFKVEYGTSGAATAPAIWITIGTGSDGAGNITGIFVARYLAIGNGYAQIPSSTNTQYVSMACYVDGCFWILFKVGGTTGSNNMHFLKIERTVDNTGVATSDGIGLFAYTTSSIRNTYTFNPVATYSNKVVDAEFAFTTSMVNGAAQVERFYNATPKIIPSAYTLRIMVAAEIPQYSVFTCLNLGVTPRTYICLGSTGNAPFGLGFGYPALIWE